MTVAEELCTCNAFTYWYLTDLPAIAVCECGPRSEHLDNRGTCTGEVLVYRADHQATTSRDAPTVHYGTA